MSRPIVTHFVYFEQMSIFDKLIIHMGELSDPRVLGRSRHKLIDIMVIGVVAIICHAESWYEMEAFGHAKEAWFRKFLELPNGIPSHDTFDRVFGLVEPKEFEICFMNWVEEVRVKVKDDTICIDGKTSKGTMKSHMGHWRDCLHTVSAWSTVSGIVLGQLKADGPGNSEISAAKELLEKLNVKGLTVVGDAGIGRESTVRKIREKKGNYVFPVKGNVNGFMTKLENVFGNIAIKKSRSKYVDQFTSEDKGHGRIETRTTTIIKKPNFPEGLNDNKDGTQRFQDLNVVGRIVYQSIEKETRPSNNRNAKDIENASLSEIVEGQRIKTETRYFISNLDGTAEFFTEKIRLQWSIENQLHWVLDVSLGEDGNRTRNKVAAENLATVRKIAVNLIKQENSKRRSVRTKLKLAGWDQSYLEQVIFQTKLG